MPSLGKHDRLQSTPATKAQIERARVEAESIVKVGEHALQFDRASRDRMTLVIKGLKTGETVEWVMMDNTAVTFTKAELQKLYVAAEAAAGRQIIKVHARARQFKERLAQGESVTLRDIQAPAWTGD